MNVLQSAIKSNIFEDNEELNVKVVEAMLNDTNKVQFFTWAFDLNNPHVTNYLFWYDLKITCNVFLNWFKNSPDQVNWFFQNQSREYRNRMMEYVVAIESFGCKFNETTVNNPIYFDPKIVERLNVKLDIGSICYLLENFDDMLDLYLDDPQDELYIKYVYDSYQVLLLVANKENNHEFLMKCYIEKLLETGLIKPVELLENLN